MDVDPGIWLDLIKHIPAVVIFWFLMVRPHMQKIEQFMQRVAISGEESAESLNEIKKGMQALEHRVKIVEDRLDNTPALGLKARKEGDG